MTLTGRVLLYGAVIAVCVAAAAAQTVGMDQVGVVAGLAVPAGAASVFLVFRNPLVGVQLAFLAVPLELYSVRLGAVGLSPSETLLLLTALASLVRWAVQGRFPPVPPVLRGVAFVCLLVALGYTVADDKVIVTKVLAMWSAFTVVAIMVAEARPAELRRILYAIAIAGGIVGAIAVAKGGQQSLVAGGEIATGRAEGSFQQPNVLGFYLVMAIPAAVVLAARGPWAARVGMGLTAAFGIWGLTLSLSRTSLLGTILGFAVLTLWRPFRRAALVLLTGLLVFSLANFKALEHSQQISVVSGRLGTLAHASTVRDDPRVQIYKTAPKIIAAHPLLGVGEGNFSLALLPYGLFDQDGLPYDHAHDIALTFGAELGIPGLLALLFIVFHVGRLALRAIAARGDPETGTIGLALAAAMVGVLITNLGDYPPRTNVIAAAFLVEVGALVAVDRRSRALVR